MIDGLVAGKLYGRPERRVGNSSGKAFVTAKVRAATAGGETLFVNVLTFDAGAQTALLALADGDAVALAGTLTPKVWTDREGQARPALDMVAGQVLTAYQVKKRRETVAAASRDGEQRQQAQQHTQGSGEFESGDDAWLNGAKP